MVVVGAGLVEVVGVVLAPGTQDGALRSNGLFLPTRETTFPLAGGQAGDGGVVVKVEVTVYEIFSMIADHLVRTEDRSTLHRAEQQAGPPQTGQPGRVRLGVEC